MTLYIYHNGKEFISFTEEKLKKLNQATIELITINNQIWSLYEKRVYAK